MFRVVMAENMAHCLGSPDPLDHRGMVEGIGKHHTARQSHRQGREGRGVGNIARGEQQPGLLAVQAGQLPLQQHMIMVGAGNIAGAARAGAAFVQRLVHRLQNLGVLGHAEVVVGAPDRDPSFLLAAKVAGAGKIPAVSFDVIENAVAALGLDRGNGLCKIFVIIKGHGFFS